MGGNKRKFSSKRRVKRTFSSNQHIKQKKNVVEQRSDEMMQIVDANVPGPSNITVSESKLSGKLLESSTSQEHLQGNRIFDVEPLESVFKMLPCPGYKLFPVNRAAKHKRGYQTC